MPFNYIVPKKEKPNDWLSDDVIKDDKNQKLNDELKQKLETFFDGWTAHGFVKVYQNGSKVKRIAWLLICLVFLGYSGYLSCQVIIEYFNYPKTISITHEEDTITTFPAVTLCNLNPIVKDKEALQDDDIWKYFLEIENENTTAECDDLTYDDGDYILLETDLLSVVESIQEESEYYTDYYSSGSGDYYSYYYYGSGSDYGSGSGSGSGSGAGSGSGSGAGSGSESGAGEESGDGSDDASSTQSTDGSDSDSDDSSDDGLESGTGNETAAKSVKPSMNAEEIIAAMIREKDSLLDFDDYDMSKLTRAGTPTKNNSREFPHYLEKYASLSPEEVKNHRINCSSVYPALMYMSTIATSHGRLDLEPKTCNINDFNETVYFSTACKTDVIHDVFGAYLRSTQPYTEIANPKVEDEYIPSCKGANNKSYVLDQLGVRLEYELDKEVLKKILSTSRTTDMSDVRDLYSPSKENILKHSLKKQEFIISCSFDNQPCSFKDFYEWISDHLGKCYTFNSIYTGGKKNKKPKSTPLSGPSTGLKVTLDLNTKDHLRLLSPDVGIRVAIHPPNIMPFPEDEGINISPGITTSAPIVMQKIKRIGDPYGKCRERDYYYKGTDLEPNQRFDYTMRSCQKLCLEATIREWCSCKFAKGPFYALLESQSSHFKEMKYCSPFNYRQKYCIEAVQYSFRSGGSEELCECYQACDQTMYKPSIAITHKNNDYYKIIQNMKKIKTGQDICSDSDNATVRLQVYIDSMEYELVKESPAYTFPSFLSNMGGSLGLFLGFSLISICEVIELIIDVIYITIKNKKNN